jgi:hypothetical protein
MYILKSSVSWKVSSEKYGRECLETEITRMQTMFLVLKHPKNIHVEFLSISEVAAGKRHDLMSN